MATNLSRKSKRSGRDGAGAQGERSKVRHGSYGPPGGASGRLPPLRPVLPGARRPRLDAAGEPATIGGLILAVIAAVNARGMCATAAAKIAALPSGDMDDIASLCRCSDCLRLRAN